MLRQMPCVSETSRNGRASTRRLLLVLALTGLTFIRGATAAAAPALTPSLIPLPSQLLPGTGAFVLQRHARIVLPQDPQARAAGRYFMELLEHTRGMPLTTDGKGPPAVVFRIEQSAESAPESYALTVTPQGITVTAANPAGLFYGGITLWQLCTQRLSRTSRITLPALAISDAPRFTWRGLMLDSARHYQPPEFIAAFMDWMAQHKLNVLHWHLTDDQGWRLEIKKYPRLTAIGAWRVPAGHAAQTDIDPATGKPRLYGGYYSQETVRQLVAHAASRHITVVPEIDMPGHASAAITAYPWLGVREPPLTAVPDDSGVYPNLLSPAERTFGFVDDVLDEVVALFPGHYIHMGGDEAVKDQWQTSPEVQARMRELGISSEAALQGYFMQRLEKSLAARGRAMIGWDEILEGGVPQAATVMSWRGLEGAVAAARAGHDTILSPSPVLYLDNRQGAGPNEPPGRGRLLTLEEVYRFEPMPAALSAEEGRHVLGLQANLWTEHMRLPERVAYMAFPRAAAVAESGWSRPGNRSWESFEQRLPAQLARYRVLGIPHAGEPEPVLGAVPGRLKSQELASCTHNSLLALEDDAPLQGPRAVFLADIMNPCWLYPATDLSQPKRITAAVGQVPFNFQLGKAIEGIKLHAPHSPSGELEVRADGCEGDPVATLPLTPALPNDAVTQLPGAVLPPIPGRHTLCLNFTQASLDPLWVLDWVQLQ